MPIEVNVTDQNVQVSTSGQTVNASVSGGVGPAGPTGPQGPTGPAGTTTWSGITDKPSTFTPTTHASTHAAAGSDPVTLSTSQIQTGGWPGSLAALNTLIDSLNEMSSDWGDARANVIECAERSHTHAASDINSGTLATARLGSGTASASTYLRGDQTWATISTYTLPAATTSTLGGVIVGSGLSVSSGTVSANVASVAGRTGAVSLTTSDISAGGSVYVSAINQLIADINDAGGPLPYVYDSGSGTFSPPAHTHSASAITSGTLSTGVLPFATTSLRGAIVVGAGLAVSSGTVSVSYGTTSGTACQGNDSRLSDARTPTDGSVTDAKIASAGLSTASLNWAAIQPWAASTAYAKGDLVSYLGVAYRRSVAGTSGATFVTSNWQQITPSDFVAGQITSGTLAAARLPVVLEQTQTIGSTGSTRTLSLASGSVQTATLSASCTFTMPTATAGASITLVLTQSGSFTATFTGVKWPGGTAPTITATANAVDVLVFVSDGTSWYGAAQQKFS